MPEQEEPLNLPPYHVYAANLQAQITSDIKNNDANGARTLMLNQINLACNMAGLVRRSIDQKTGKIEKFYIYSDRETSVELEDSDFNKMSLTDLWDLMNYFNFKAGLSARQAPPEEADLYKLSKLRKEVPK